MSRTSRASSTCSRRSSLSSTRRCPASGDNVNLDEELQTVLRKEYEEGEEGKNDALQDVQTVLKEVSQDPMAQVMDKLLPRFLTASSTSGDSLHEEPINRQQDVKGRNKSPPPLRHAKLTARPVARGRSNQRQHQLTGESASVPNIPPKPMLGSDAAPTRPATSSAKFPETTRSRYSASSFSSEQSSTPSMTTTELESSQRSAKSKMPIPKKKAVDKKDDKEDEKDELPPSTENLRETPTTTATSEDHLNDTMKADIVALTRLKPAPKKARADDPFALELKYKEPIWPHHLFLNEILARRPSLAHLVLDKSELRFLRDLGSSLQSLTYLSVCDCKLRSLDGLYGMPNLRTLIARSNLICIPTQCSYLALLSHLDLSSNPISTFDEFSHLELCGELRIVKLHDTPLATHPNFNKEMKRLLPQLKEIHPPQYDIFAELKQIRKEGQQQMREESKSGEDKGMGRTVPSLAYDDVMLAEPKSGIAYQKIPKTKQTLQLQPDHQQQEGADLEEGEYTQVYMAPKFLQHLVEAMPPSTAELQAEEELKIQNHRQGHNFVASTADSSNYDEEVYLGDVEEDELKLNSSSSSHNIRKKGTGGVNQLSGSTRNHPRGDGDSCL